MKINSHTLDSYILEFQRKPIPNVGPGDIVTVSERIFEGKKSRVQKFQGIVLMKKNKNKISCNILVRKKIENVFVEKRFFLFSPLVEEVKIESKGSPRRAVLSYLRQTKHLTQKLKRLKK